MVGSPVQVDVLQDSFAGRESRRQEEGVVREMVSRSCKKRYKVLSLLFVVRVLPYNYQPRLLVEQSPRALGSSLLLSMPSKPEASTNPLAERPKLSRSSALAATAGQTSDELPPPMDRITRRCGCCCFRCISEPNPP